jgi:hypothetical protein
VSCAFRAPLNRVNSQTRENQTATGEQMQRTDYYRIHRYGKSQLFNIVSVVSYSGGGIL